MDSCSTSHGEHGNASHANIFLIFTHHVQILYQPAGEPLDPKTGHSSFRRPCFQRGEVREKSQFPAGPTFPPEIWQKDLIEPACLAYVPTLDTFKVGDIEGPARKFRTQAELSRGKNHAQKTMTTHENLLSLAADSGADTNKNHNNQPYKHFHTYLGRVSLHFWVDWAAVALTVSLLIRGPFSRTRTQVDCFDLYFLIQ